MKILIPYLHDDGGLELSFPMNVDYTKQIFSHTSEDGQVRHYYVNKLHQMAMDLFIPQRLINVDLDHAKYLITNGGIEPPHLARITQQQLLRPGIIVDFGANQLMVDGGHRYIKLWMLKYSPMTVFWFTEEQAKKALLAFPNEYKPGA